MSNTWFDVIDGTWPAAGYHRCGPFTLRRGQGGGSRVSAATADAPANSRQIEQAEQAMRELDQSPIFMIRPDDTALDARLAGRGYGIADPVKIFACSARSLSDRPLPPVTAFTIWEPLHIMREIWQGGGIGAARQAIMERAPGPKTGILGRISDKPAGAGFVAVHGCVAMVHALEILPDHRRRGLGNWMMRAAALWALDNGAETLSVMCTRENRGANALYRALGMEGVGSYHYRRRDQGDM